MNTQFEDRSDAADRVTELKRYLPDNPVAGPSGGWLPGLSTTQRRIVIAAVVALLLVLIAWAVMRSGAGAAGKGMAATDDRPLITVISASPKSFAATVSVTGTISARFDMPISAEGEGGRVAALLVEAGDRVRKGQVLARLDMSVLRPQVASLAAALEESRASSSLATADYERAQAVAGTGALSAEEVERRRSSALAAAAKVKVAEAQLAEARARMGRAEIRAPDDGIVLTRSAEIGQTVSAGSGPLFRLARDGEVELRGQIAEKDMPQLRPDQPVRVFITGVDQPFDGRVRLVGAVIDPATRLGEVRVALPSHADLRPGAFARGEITVDQSTTPVLPQTAVLADEDGTYVMIVDAQNKVAKRQVRTGGTRSGGVVINTGLKGDERVVATAAAFLREGEEVRIADEPVQADEPAQPGGGES
ncbi:MAG: efflux RND transporter periplasmic adaptor subunit [Steroidobacteraceae bacterium]